MKCARAVCNATGTQSHRDLPGLYCLACAHKINAANGVELVGTSPPAVTAETLMDEEIIALLREYTDGPIGTALRMPDGIDYDCRTALTPVGTPRRDAARARVAAAINSRRKGSNQ